MATHNVKRKLVAILAADVVGFSRLMGGNEEQTMRVLNAHRAVIDGIIEYHEGRIVNTAGDSVLAEFRGPADAVRCAVEIQDALKTRNNSLPEAERLHFRIGINLGDVMIKGDDLLGDGVNIAARLESIAEPGGICISSSIYDQIAGKLDLGFVEIGEQHLKNIERPIRVYRVATGVARPAPAPARKAAGLWLYATGVAAIVLAAVAVVQQLRESPPVPPTAPPVSAPPVATTPAPAPGSEAQRALEAQRNAEEKARAEIAAAKARADAEVAKARAEVEVAKARAEVELVRRRAAAEGEAQRALEAQRNAEEKARAEIAAAKARADAEVAAAPARQQEPLASPAPAPAAKTEPQVVWIADRSCAASGDLGAFKDRVGVSVANGEFVVEQGQPGQPGYMVVRGKPADDDTLRLAGYGIGAAGPNRGKQGPVTLAGRREGDQYRTQGMLGARACTLTISQAAAGVAAARARQPDVSASPVVPPLSAAKPSLRGTWVADRSCESFQEQVAFKDQLGVAISDVEFIVERGQPGQPGYTVMRGKPGADGKLRLEGYVLVSAAAVGTVKGKTVLVYEGRLEGDRYLLKAIGKRACTLTISRR